MKRLCIVMYHYVRDLKNSRYPEIKGLDYSLFKEQLEFFAAHFHTVTMEDVIACYEEGKELPDNALLLTFDDGYIDHYTFVYPMLRRYGMQGSFFIPAKVFMEHTLLDVNKIHFILAAAPIEKLCKELMGQLDRYRGQEWDYPSNQELIDQYMVANRFDNKETIFFKRVLQFVLPEKLRNQITSELFEKVVGISETVMAHELYLNYDQMMLMKKGGMYFGIHGYDHYWMNKLTQAQLQQDIDKALKSLGGLIDLNKWVINYPYGSYSDEVRECARKMGCVMGLATDVRIADLEKDDPYKLPRLDTNDFPPKSENYLKIV